jgi:flagellar biosynthetic protein FliQ
MDSAAIVHVASLALGLAAKLAAPALLTALAVGVLISVIQSMTQIQEVTLSFVPKAAAVAIVLVITGNWMLTEFVQATHALFDTIPELLGG